MAECDGRNTGGDERAPDGPIPELSVSSSAEESLFGRREPTPRDLFACPFCETPVQLTTRPEARGLVAECPSCETWFTVEEWRYYKQVVV